MAKKKRLQREKIEAETKGRRKKVQWRRFKLGTVGVIFVAIVASFMIYSGILIVLDNEGWGYALLFSGIILWAAVVLDIYRMYGY